jgi:formate dehydrogenase iron-sulfur subunit
MSDVQQLVTALADGAGPDEPRGLLAAVLYGFEKGAQPGQVRPHTFFTDTSICTGCKACEVACKQWNQLPVDDVRWGQGYDNTHELSATSWRHVKFVERFPETWDAAARLPLDDVEAILAESKAADWLILSDQCKHCADSPCHDACPTGAIVYTEYGGVFIQSDICVGCSSCVTACPFGVITRSEIDGHAHKCTMCYDRLRDGLPPACAQACTTGAIAFGERAEMLRQARARLEQLRARYPEASLYGAEPTSAYTELHNIYLLLDAPRVYGLPDEPVSPRLVHLTGDYLRAAAGLAAAAAIVVLAILLGWS